MGSLRSSDGLPIATIKFWSGPVAPPGYVFCDGAAVGRKRYPALFRKLGTRCGAGDGTMTFNVPHFREQDTGTVRWVIKAEPTEQQLLVSFQISEFAQLALARPDLPAHLHQAAHFLESMVVAALDDA